MICVTTASSPTAVKAANRTGRDARLRDSKKGRRGVERMSYDEPLAVHQVAERHQEDQAQAVADLRDRG